MRAAGRTDVGRQRAANEDSILLVPERGLFAVADGMGGHRGGRVASQMVTGELARISREKGRPLRQRELERAMREINARVHETGEANEDLHAMGSTCVAVSIDGAVAHVVHVGDSRCYLRRGDGARRLTTDHRAIQAMIDTGAISEQESRVHPLRNVLTRSVGVESQVDLEYLRLELEPGDRLLLCSDGLSDMLAESQLLAMMDAEDDLEALVGAYVDAANEAGGLDNISVIVLDPLVAPADERRPKGGRS